VSAPTARRRFGYVPSRRGTVRSAWACGAAMALCILDGLVAFTGSATGIGYALFLAVFPLLARTILTANALRLDPTEGFGKGLLPAAVQYPIRAALLACWAGGLFCIVTIHGQPERLHGRFVVNDHGSETVVSRAEYRRQHAKQDQIFDFIPGAFYGAMLLASLSTLRVLDDPRRMAELHDGTEATGAFVRRAPD
jgi:hypothetical protein